MTRLLPLCCALAFLLSGACGNSGTGSDPFSATGEVIAYSGGSGGAVNACVTCHGLKGEGDGNLTPRLAGLDRGYLVRQLDSYAEGRRTHSRMAEVARRLSPAQRQLVAAYYNNVPADAACGGSILASRLHEMGDPRRGIPACASCHGADGQGNAGNPPLAGQPEPYLVRQLRDWRDGNRYGDPRGDMTRISKALTPAELAAWTGDAGPPRDGIGRPEPPAECPPPRRGDPRNGA